MKIPAGSAERAPRPIDDEVIRQRVIQNLAPVAGWATARLQRNVQASSGIAELYADYVDYCRQQRCQRLGRKVWLAAMKLAGFETQSGEFVRLALAQSRAD